MEILYTNFPKLRDAGGFEYLKADGATKVLHTITLPTDGGFNAVNLKTLAKHSRIYLRPVQCDLDLTNMVSKLV